MGFSHLETCRHSLTCLKRLERLLRLYCKEMREGSANRLVDFAALQAELELAVADQHRSLIVDAQSKDRATRDSCG
jgi:hypothetical protein